MTHNIELAWITDSAQSVICWLVGSSTFTPVILLINVSIINSITLILNNNSHKVSFFINKLITFSIFLLILMSLYYFRFNIGVEDPDIKLGSTES